jgi:hypothetical protein
MYEWTRLTCTSVLSTIIVLITNDEAIYSLKAPHSYKWLIISGPLQQLILELSLPDAQD